MRFTNCRSGLLALGLLFAATPARADIIYPVSYSGIAVGFGGCDKFLGDNCSVSADGSVLTLFNNGGSLSFRATPLSGSFVASNVAGVLFPVVTIFSTVTGPFETLPLGWTNEALFSMSVSYSFTTPDGPSGGSLSASFYRHPGNATGNFAVNYSLRTLPSPSLPSAYRVDLWSTSPPYVTFGAANTSGTLFSGMSIAPEPSTIVLSASGLGMLGLFGLRRKRRSV